MTSRLKTIMDKRGITVKEVAQGSDLSPSTVRNIYNGSTKEPTLATMYHIAVFLRVRISDIF